MHYLLKFLFLTVPLLSLAYEYNFESGSLSVDGSNDQICFFIVCSVDDEKVKIESSHLSIFWVDRVFGDLKLDVENRYLKLGEFEFEDFDFSNRGTYVLNDYGELKMVTGKLCGLWDDLLDDSKMFHRLLVNSDKGFRKQFYELLRMLSENPTKRRTSDS